ncbi:hypothetical protein M9Y10_023026 [Tritrichomonas musculus]|uniref:DUF3447 domain-containing protein n=1 Tax=Tritrichomonas musculus TaxID=1915356 RepID=A0ABR2KX63_9EUKA
MYSESSKNDEDTIMFVKHSFHQDQSKSRKFNEPSYRILYLFSKNSFSDFYENMPKTFTISTKNSTLHFNIQMLKETSPVISKFVQDNPNENNYSLNLTDDDNILVKFAQLYQGKSIIFEEGDIPLIQRFTQLLQIKNCPNFLKPKSLATAEFDSYGYYNVRFSFYEDPKENEVSIEIYQKYLLKFLRRDDHQVFKIKTNKKEYICNIFSVYTSKVIRELLEKDSNCREFFYDFEDKNDDFQLVCDFFNYKLIDLKKVNIETMRKIAEDLQISCIIKAIDNYHDHVKKFSEKIEKYEGIIDKIDELFDMLYNIRTHGIEKVKNRIIESGWFREERRVEELSAFIISVVKVNFSLQKDICELLIKLKEEENDDNKFQLLIPFTIERLMTLYWPHNCLIKNEKSTNKSNPTFAYYCNTEETINLTNRCVYSFIRILYKRGLISKEELFEPLKNYALSNNALNAFFLPELIEINPKNIEIIANMSRKKFRFKPYYLFKDSLNYFRRENLMGMYYFWPKFALKYLPDKIGLYEEMLDKMEPDDELTKSIWYDDVDSFQRIISRDGIDMKKYRILYNIFDDFEEKMNLINYSALYGSIKCFKFIILNEGEIDESTFYFSICGGNNEIIKIVDQKIPKNNRNPNFNRAILPNDIYYDNINDKNRISFWFNCPKIKKNEIRSHSSYVTPEYDKYNDNNIQHEIVSDESDPGYLLNYSNINNIIAPTIAMCKNDIFDWTFENYFLNLGKSGNDMKYIAILSAASGNVHSLITLLDNGFHITRRAVSAAAKNGFYTLTKMLLDLYDSDSSVSYGIDHKSIVLFKNLSIFELFSDIMNQIDLKKAILKAIKINCTKIVKYVFDNFDKFDFLLYNDEFIKLALINSLSIKTTEMFNFLFDYFNKLKPELFNVDLFSTLLIRACLNSNLEVTKEVTEMILKEDDKYDFTTAFFKASSSKSMSICQYFIDNKVLIEFENNPYIGSLGGISFELFENIIKSIDPKIKFLFYECVHEAILNKNKKLIEIIFEEKPPKGNELFEGVQTEDIEIVDLILKYNSEPSFVNKVTVDGTCLCLAVNLRNKEIVERLLCVPGINLNLYDSRNQTPLAIAVENHDLELVDIILNYLKKSDSRSIEACVINASQYFGKKNLDDRFPLIGSSWEISLKLSEIKFVDVSQHNSNRYMSQSLLICACMHNKVNYIEKLLELGVNINVYEPEFLSTPLMVSLHENYLELAKIIIKHPKTNINSRNKVQETALTIAVRNKQKEIIDLLVKDERFDPFESKLSCAFTYSCNEIAQQLSSLSFLDVNEYHIPFSINSLPSGIIKVNALEHSVEINDDAKIDMIINHHSFDIYKSQVNRSIFIAAKNNNINVFQKLMKLIDNDVNIHQDTKENLLSYASRNLSGDIVDLIINNKCSDQILDAFVNTYSSMKLEKPNKTRNDFFVNDRPGNYILISDTNQEVMNPELLPKKITLIEMMQKLYNYDNEHGHLINFDKFCKNGKSFFTVIVNDFPEISEVCDFLIEHGADPNKADKNGNYPLEHAIRINSLGMATSLLNSNKINLNQTKNGFSYLHLAAQNKNSEILSLLLEKNKIDVNSVNEQGDTPLIEACKAKCIGNIKVLFKRDDIDFNHCNKDGKDALDITLISLPPGIESIRQNKEKYRDKLISVINEMLNSNN